MRNKTGPVADAEYVFVRGLFRLLRFIRYKHGLKISRAVLTFVLFILGKRRRLIHRQIAESFPERTPDQHRDIAQQSIENLARGIAWYPKIPAIVRNDLQHMLGTEGFEHVREALRVGKGAITFTGHYGFWEMMAIHVTKLFPDVSMVVRPLDNPKVDALITSIRSSNGGHVIDSRQVFKQGIRALRRNGIVGILIDQNFYKGGVFVNFFGRLAATNTLVPILARRTGCAVLPMHNVWRNGQVITICEPPVSLSTNPDLNEAILEDTQMLTSYVEKWIREDPGQWLWLHNRWKRRPNEEELALYKR